MNEHETIADASGEVIDVHRPASGPAGGAQPPSVNAGLPLLLFVLGLLVLFDVMAPLSITRDSFLALAIAAVIQVALHAGWIVLGPGHYWWRIGSVPLLVTLLGWMTSPLSLPEQAAARITLFEHWLLVAACMFPLRAMDFRVRPESLAAERPSPARQFSISYLFGLLTLASFAIGVATQINVGHESLQDPLLWITAALLLVVTVPPIPAVLMPRDPWPWCLGAFFLPIVAIVLMSAVLSGNTEFRGTLLYTASMSATEFLLLAVLRLAGFRLRRPLPTSCEPTTDAGAMNSPAPLQSA